MKILNILLLTFLIFLINSSCEYRLPVFVGWDYWGDKEGYKDGIGNQARFKNLKDFDIDNNGNLFVIDDNKIRKITSEGFVSTFAGDKKNLNNDKIIDLKIENPVSIAIDKNQNIYISEEIPLKESTFLIKITPEGIVSKLEIKQMIDKDGKKEVIPFQFEPKTLEINNKGDMFLMGYDMKIYKIENDIASFFIDIEKNLSSYGSTYDLNIDSKNNIFISLYSSVFPTYTLFLNYNNENSIYNYIKNKYNGFKLENFFGCCITIDEEDNLYIADPDQSHKNVNMPLGTKSVYKFSKNGKFYPIVKNAIIGNKLKMIVDSKNKYLYLFNVGFTNIERIKLEDE